MRNEHYSKAVSAVKTLNTKGKTLFGALVAFVVASVYNEAVPAVGTDVKPLFKEQEKQALVEDKVEMGKNSTYRVVKGLLVQCVAKGIDIRGKGKTDLESMVADTKVEKSAIEKFKTMMTGLTSVADKLDAKDRLVAAALVQDLLKKVTTGIQLAA